MPGLRLVRFLLALLAELGLCAAFNLFDDWTLEQMPGRFVATAIAGGIAYLIAVANFPTSLRPKQQAWLFWGVAVVLRLAVLPLAPGDDYWRYQWEGKVQQAGFNPYTHLPDHPELTSLREDFPYWYKINRRDYKTAYPPGAELLFANLPFSSHPLSYKLLFAVADLAGAAVLLRLISGKARYAAAAYYAWNPLVAYCSSGLAHLESLTLLPALIGLFYLTRHEAAQRTSGRWQFALAAAVSLGAAFSLQLAPLVILLPCAFALGARAVALLATLAFPAVLSLFYGFPHVPIWNSLADFPSVRRLNDLFWWLLEEVIWPYPRQRNFHYYAVTLVAVVVISLLFTRNWRRGLLWVTATATILAPVFHPWYCLWILPIAAWRRTEPWFVLSITIFAYFLFWNERLFALPWHSELWLRGIIILPPLIAIVFFLMRGRDESSAATE